ncbi:hypothetical protein ACFE04_010784 [Oxalis oulophora]
MKKKNTIFLSLLLLLLSLTNSTVTAALPSLLPNCNQTFSCNNFTKLSYPFTGGKRPSYCGPPQFHLTCHDNTTTTIQNSTNSVLSYKLMQLDVTHHAMILTRSDLFRNTSDSCSQLNSTTSSLDPNVYTLSEDENIYMTIFYACSERAKSFSSWVSSFSCQINNKDTAAYYMAGKGFLYPSLGTLGCNVTVTVPVVKSVVYSNGSVIEDVLDDGFNVSYKNPYEDHCQKCKKIGGFCGFDEEAYKAICICDDVVCDVPGTVFDVLRIHFDIRTKYFLYASFMLLSFAAKFAMLVWLCSVITLYLLTYLDSLSIAGSKDKKQLLLGLAIGLPLFFGAFLGSIIAVYLLKRKKKNILVYSKGLKGPDSSNGFTTPSTNHTGSTTSYPSSNSDLEKGSTYFGAQIFTFAELEEATEKFNPAKELGDGGFGTVYYGKLKDGRVVAVKRLYENNFKRAGQFMNEIEILSHLRHPNLVTLYGCTSKQSRELILVYEYVSNGTVADHIHENGPKSGLLSWPIRLRIAVETATALTYLHASDVIHRDVKSNNILLNRDFSVKVADFGMSRLFPTNVTHVSTAPQGTPGYVDPEYYQCYQLTDKSDVFSFGVVLVELISSKEAVDINRSRQDINLANMAVSRIQNHALHELVDPRLGFENNDDVRRTITSVGELAFRCLQQDKDLRPSMSEVLEALKEIENEEIGKRKPDIVDIGADEIALLKIFTPPRSPDSGTFDGLANKDP